MQVPSRKEHMTPTTGDSNSSAVDNVRSWGGNHAEASWAGVFWKYGYRDQHGTGKGGVRDGGTV